MRTRNRVFILLVATALSSNGKASAEEYEFREELDRALIRFTAEKQELREEMIRLLRRKEAAATAAGQKAVLDRVVAELAEFERRGIPPTIVSSKDYLAAVRRAQRTVDSKYVEVIKNLTRAKRLDEADQVQKELHKVRRENVGSRLYPGQILLPGEMIYSSDGRFELEFQHNGNLALGRIVKPPVELWNSNTSRKHGRKVVMQTDGNLVILNHRGKPVWASGTHRHPRAYLELQTDGNVVIYKEKQRKALWSTRTRQ